jgi:hypothetical protein
VKLRDCKVGMMIAVRPGVRYTKAESHTPLVPAEIVEVQASCIVVRRPGARVGTWRHRRMLPATLLYYGEVQRPAVEAPPRGALVGLRAKVEEQQRQLERMRGALSRLCLDLYGEEQW